MTKRTPQEIELAKKHVGEVVLTVKNFLRWNEEKFESLHKDAPKIANPVG